MSRSPDLSPYPLLKPIPDWRRLQGYHPDSSQFGVGLIDLVLIGVGFSNLASIRVALGLGLNFGDYPILATLAISSIGPLLVLSASYLPPPGIPRHSTPLTTHVTPASPRLVEVNLGLKTFRLGQLLIASYDWLVFKDPLTSTPEGCRTLAKFMRRIKCESVHLDKTTLWSCSFSHSQGKERVLVNEVPARADKNVPPHEAPS
jgi:hypothetical protein